jgi:hypothetical protein
MLAAGPDQPWLAKSCPLRVAPRTRWPVLPAAESWRLELSTLALSMLAALPAAVLDPTSRARMLLPCGPALHVGSRARQVTTCQALSPPRHAACMLACVARRGTCAVHAGAPHTGGAPAVVSELCLRPGCSGHGLALHVGSLAQLVTARQALSPPRRAVCTRALCGPPRRPGALHAGALHAGSAPSCGLGAGVTVASWAQELRTRTCSSGGLPGLARLVTARKALSPPSRAACLLSLGGPLRRPGAPHAGALHTGGAPSCGLRAGVSGPDAPIPDPLCMWAAWPDGHGSSSSASSVSCHVHAGPVRSDAASWSTPRRRSPRWRRSQRWPYSRRLGPGCSGQGTDLHVGSLARPASAHQALSPPRRAVCTRALCGRSGVLELSTLALSMLVAL